MTARPVKGKYGEILPEEVREFPFLRHFGSSANFKLLDEKTWLIARQMRKDRAFFFVHITLNEVISYLYLKFSFGEQSIPLRNELNI